MDGGNTGNARESAEARLRKATARIEDIDHKVASLGVERRQEGEIVLEADLELQGYAARGREVVAGEYDKPKTLAEEGETWRHR